MKTEDQAWRQLQQHAAAQLSPDFASNVLRSANGPAAATWRQLQTHAAEQLRPGFAERVLRAARSIPRMPSFTDQLALAGATIAVCLIGVLYVHSRTLADEEELNLASWHQLAAEIQDAESPL